MRRHHAHANRCLRGLFAAVALTALAAATADAAGLLSSTGPIDRRTESIGWCPSTDFPPNPWDYPSISFIADGTRATFEITASNLDSAGTYWTQQTIDNLCVVSRVTFDTYFSDSSDCTNCSTDGHLGFDLVPPAEIIYLERFDTGTGGWDLSEGAFYNATSTAARDPNGLCDYTGGSLALGAMTGPDTVRTRYTVSGLTSGTEYVFTWWWRYVGDAVVTDEEILIDVWGTDPWVDATPAGISTFVESHGGSWGDYDGDGDPDLYITQNGVGQANRLFRNDGALAFADVTPAALADSGYAIGTTWIDPDNDYDLDLMVSNQIFGTNHLWENDAGTWNDVTHPLLVGASNTTAFTWADWDLDGDLDAYHVQWIGENALLRNDGEDLVDVTPLTLGDGFQGSAAVWSDYDLDGDPDLYLVLRDAPNRLFRNDLSGNFVDVTTAPLDDAGLGTCAIWADFDNDLDPDLLLVNLDGTGTIFRNDLGSFAPKFTFAETQALGMTSGDWDLDGDIDFAIARQGSGNLVFRNDGTLSFTQTAGGPLPMSADEPTFSLSAADADGDGDLDLFAANWIGTPDRLLENDQDTGHHWLHVDLKGTASNVYGLGTKLFATTALGTQFREVSDELVLTGQNSITAEFGLGSATTVTELKVVWPSGTVQYVSNVAADQRIVVIEGDGVDAPVVVPGPTRFGLRAPRPNPFGDATTLRFDLPEAGRATVTVYDVRGRLLAGLLDRQLAAGAHQVTWNGSDGAGRAIAPGIYFVRLRAGDLDSVQRVVRIR